MKRCVATCLLGLGILPCRAEGYIRLLVTYTDGSSAYLKRNDPAGTQFYINNLIAPGLTSSASGALVTVISPASTPIQAIRSAAATWNSVAGSSARFLALQSTSKVADSADHQNTIVVGSTAADLSALGFVAGVTPGALAVTATMTSYTPGTSTAGIASESDIVLNPSVQFSTDGSTTADLQAVVTHELGHSLGLNHSGLLGATMFQYSQSNQQYLSADEVSFVSSVYPAPSAAPLAVISGKVQALDGSPVQGALVELIDTTGGNALSALTGADGTYSTSGPPGSYVVYAEPLSGTSIVQAGNLYLPAAATLTTNFQPTVLGGVSSLLHMAVTSGSPVSVPSLTVTAGTSILTLPYIGFGKAAGAADILNVSQKLGPIPVISGQSIDIGLTGGGVDASVSLQVLGQGISVRAGSVHADPNVSFGGQPLIRATLDITSHSVPSLASILIVKGLSTYVLSGILVLVPPTPTFTTNAVVNAASYKGSGVVSPGGISSIYDSTGNSLGPNPYVQNTSYDLYGNLPVSAGGVTVTFDGVPAPIYLAYAGQLNVQVPFEVAGKSSTQVVVNYYGSRSAPVKVAVAGAQPAFFTFTPNGADAIIQNFPDYSLNGAGNAIPRGGVAVLYGTGIGQLPYTLATGQPGVVPPSSYASRYSCSFGGQSSGGQNSGAYAYWNYGFVGEATWTVPIPANSPTGAVALTCTDAISGASTPQGTIYIK